MKKIIFVFLITTLLSLVGAAQNNRQSRQIQAETNVQAQLQQNLDVKNTKVGDEVILKVSKAIKQNGETVVPKGANIIGRVTEVQQHSKNNADSKLSVVFDRLRNQNLDAPISASIVSITRTAANVGADDNLSSDITSDSSGSVSRGNSRGRTSGGLLGGAGNTVAGAGNTVGSVAGSAVNTVGGVTNSAGAAVGGAAQSLNRSISGIQISQTVGAAANGSTTLSAADKNLKLEKGLTFNLLLSASVEK